MHDEHALLSRLRAGDERAFEALVMKHDGALRRVARSYVRTDSAVDDVVQETWLGVVRGIDGFEGRSSLRTWIFRILVNQDMRRLAGSLNETPEPPPDAETRDALLRAFRDLRGDT